MEKKINRLQFIGKELLRVFLIFVVTAFLLVNSVALALRYPTVQTWAAKKASVLLSRTLDHQVSVGRVDIRFFSKVQLERVQVLDRMGQVLFYIDQVDADIELFSIFKPNHLDIGTLKLVEPHVRMVQYAGTDSLNFSTFLTALNRLIQADTAKPGTFEFSIAGIEVERGLFVFDNQNEPRSDFGVDYAHLHLTGIDLQLTDIDLKGDTIGGRVQNLRAFEQNAKVPLHDLDATITFAPTFWEFSGLNLQLADSRLGKYVRFDYSRFSDFSEFIDSVTVTADIDTARLYARDVALFAPQLREYDENMALSGKVKGKVTDFQLKDLNLRYGRSTHIVGNISLTGLPELKETFAELRLDSTTLDPADLNKFLPKEAAEFTDRLGVVSLKGQFIGFYSDFVANGRISSDLGLLITDINVKIHEDARRSSYNGTVRTSGFNLGRLLNLQPTIGTVAMSGRVQGSGFSLDLAQANLDVSVNSIQLMGYTYRNIVTNARLAKRTFNGTLLIDDPNLKMELAGNVDMRKGRESVDVQGRLERSNLQVLNLTSTPISISSQLNIDMDGLQPDALSGKAHLTDLRIEVNGESLHTDTLVLVSSVLLNERLLMLHSDFLSATLKGNFSYPELISDLQTLYREYHLNFEKNEQKLQAYYRNKRELPHNYRVSLSADLRQINPVLHLFEPQLSISRNSHLEASLNYGPNVVFTSSFTSDTITYRDMEFYSNEAELNSSKLTNEADILAMAFFKSKRQKLSSSNTTQDLLLEGVWDNEQIKFASNIAQTGTTNRAAIGGTLNFLDDRIEVALAQSNIFLLDRQWRLNPENRITFLNREIQVHNLVIYNQEQSLSLDGVISADITKVLNLDIRNFNLATLNPLLVQKIHGQLNAQLSAQDLYNDVIVNSQMRVDSFLLDSVLIGQVEGRTSWDNRRKLLEVDANIMRDNRAVLSLGGYYNPKGGQQQLNMTAVLENAPLKLAEPVLKVVMHDLAGTVDGRIRISGTPGAPLLKGTAFVTDGSFNLTYLNTVYTFTDKIMLGENDISFRNLKLQDPFGNTATVNGGVFHDGFSNMVLDMKASFRRFLVLNTTRSENPLYYGSAVATGNVSLLGSTENLKIKVDARSEKGTRLFIPLDNTSELVRQDFIKFVNRNNADSVDVTEISVQKDKVDLSGINLDFTLDVTDDAIVEIIFDERTGDIIRGAGNGQLRMDIDTRGEFHMYGQIEIARGSYVFSLFDLGLVTREFQVKPGGTITWNGDPYTGQLNVTATYTQLTSLASLIQAQDPQGTPSSGGRYPVMVLINLRGDLIEPAISLGIEFMDYPPDFESIISSYQAQLRNNEQWLHNQVFSLLVLRRLSPPEAGLGEGGTAGSGSAIGGSVGDLLSGQLAQFLSQVDNNLQVDIMVGALDQQTLDDLRVRLSYSLLSGRLQVTRQGAVSSGTGTGQGATGSQVNPAGDWTVEYFLTKDGKYRIRLQYETIFSAFDNTNMVSTSFSLLQTQRFNNFGELFRRKRAKKSVRDQIPIESEQIIIDSDVPIEL